MHICIAYEEAKDQSQFINQDGPENERQHLVINRLIDGFEGKLSTSKYAKIATCSHDTALRDINELIARKILTREAGGGRSTGYSVTYPLVKNRNES